MKIKFNGWMFCYLWVITFSILFACRLLTKKYQTIFDAEYDATFTIVWAVVAGIYMHTYWIEKKSGK